MSDKVCILLFMQDERITIRLGKATKVKLEKVAIKNKRKPSEMGRLIIEDALDKKK